MLEVSNGNRGAVTAELADEDERQLAPEITVVGEPETTAAPDAPQISAGTAFRALLSAPSRWFRSRGKTVVVGIILAGLVAALISTDLKLRHQEAVASARTSALKAADTYAVELASYDYRHLDQDFGTVRQHSSPAFQASFSQSSNALASVLAKYQATASATVLSAGVVSASTGHAVVLVFLEQTVTNSTQKKGPQKDQSRVQMSLIRSHGQWLIDQVKLL